MNGVRTIVGDALPRERGERSGSFVHQKISSRKVPVVARSARERSVETALREAGRVVSWLAEANEDAVQYGQEQ